MEAPHPTPAAAKPAKSTRRGFPRWLRRVLWVLSTLLITLVLFETAYRWQWVDFYRLELEALNPKGELDSPKPALLVMGDSFSATKESYVALLRDSLPSHRIINSAVPGTGVLQASYMARRRFRQVSPKVFVYQVYVGNDLLDIRPPYNWEKLSRTRNFYYRLSSDFRSLGWVNYRLGQGFASPEAADTLLKRRTAFSVETYNAREKLILSAEPKVIEHSVQTLDLRGQDFGYFFYRLSTLLTHCPQGDCEAYVLVIPHCAQVSEEYLHRMEQLGASFDAPLLMDAHDYPFFRNLRSHITQPNVHFVNALPALQAGEKLQPMYYTDDPHLSPAGQQVVGKLLLDSLRLKVPLH